jgi:hypothetical protein
MMIKYVVIALGLLQFAMIAKVMIVSAEKNLTKIVINTAVSNAMNQKLPLIM